MTASLNQQLTDLGKATLTYKGDFESGFNEIPKKLKPLVKYLKKIEEEN